MSKETFTRTLLRLRQPQILQGTDMSRSMRLLLSECAVCQSRQSELQEYLSKRDFGITPEPRGSKKKGEGNIFVVQEHHARTLHYDLRLEKAGVLKSWAVPKGIPTNSDQKRLAVETEDHPLGYADFEGAIPKGQYGAGTVEIWDRGVYEAKVWDEKMVEFILKGKKLKGRYVLVRLKKAEGKNWLLLKGKEQARATFKLRKKRIFAGDIST